MPENSTTKPHPSSEEPFRRSLKDNRPTSLRIAPTPKYWVVSSCEESKKLTTLNPFVIQKQLEISAGNPNSVQKLRDGSLLVEYENKQQAEKFSKRVKFHDIKVTVTPHKTLNSSRCDRRPPHPKERKWKTSSDSYSDSDVWHAHFTFRCKDGISETKGPSVYS